MLGPIFSFKVEDKDYSVSPTFGLHNEIEKAINKTIYQVLLETESFTIINLFNIYNILPCKVDFSGDQLKKWIALNRNQANKQVSDLVVFLVLPQQQEASVKKK